MMDEKQFEIADKWLADAPLFIDAGQVDRFYDAVVRPLSKLGPTTVQLYEEDSEKIAAEIKAKIEAKTPIIVAVKASLAGKIGGELSGTTSKTRTAVFEDIHTPQRQLRQLSDHYKDKYSERAFYVTDPSNAAWREPSVIKDIPRLLVFLDLPSQFEAEQGNLASVKFIPMAAEFANGKIVPLYSQVKGAKGRKPPEYDEIPQGETHRQNRRKYWTWFGKHFSATRAMELIEAAAGKNGLIQWIDFRVPVSADGDTLHVHIAPQGKYNTGVIAYRLVKRGFRHGIRVVGTMNSGPDMHVLAIYDK